MRNWAWVAEWSIASDCKSDGLTAYGGSNPSPRTGELFMPQPNLIKLQCGECKRVNYWSSKNKKKVERKIELKKFCNWCRKHTIHKETKK